MPFLDSRATCWRLRTCSLAYGNLPLLMGIVNVTPDSFSDGGRHYEPQAAIEHGLRLVAEGAAILDIGGESTRPGAVPVDAAEELRRVLPVIEGLRRQTDVPLSIDTSKAVVAQQALELGAEIVNDVTGLEGDPAMLPLVAKAECGVCLMHMQGNPRTMQANPQYTDVVAEVFYYLRRRRDAAMAAGVLQERIALDPGIGFGKTTLHNLRLLSEVWQLHELGCTVLIGHSRKRFLDWWRSVPPRMDAIGFLAAGFAAEPPPLSSPTNRLAGTIAVALAMACQGAQVLRVHDVAAVREALLTFQAVSGR